MARKNLIGISLDPENAQLPSNETEPSKSRPLAGFVPAARAAPIGGITKSLGNITQKVERVDVLERQLAEGQTVVEVDPILIDNSFVSDRLEINPAQLSELVEQIRLNGQLVPILLRQHPLDRNRYQVAFGHRRLAAARELGIKVRAVIRDLSDEQLVVNQGQENNARTNLSYIERALFAARLEERGFSRDVIMASLAIDKAALSKMLSVVKQVSTKLIEAIGAAPEVGRRRWMELGDRVQNISISDLIGALSADNTRGLTSDQRFQFASDYIAQQLSKPKSLNRPATESVSWTADDDAMNFTMNRRSKKVAIELSNANAAPFGDWLTRRLDTLYAEFKNSKSENAGD